MTPYDDHASINADTHATGEEPSVLAIIIAHENHGLLAIERCDRCGAQAYLKVTMHDGNVLLFCVHEGAKHLPALVKVAKIIDDHRPWLLAEEERLKPQSLHS